MTFSSLLLILNFATTLYMVGLIWMVQIVHYPLFAEIGPERFRNYQHFHQRWTSLVVGPPMLLEAFSTFCLAWYPPESVNAWMVFTGIGLVIVIWFSTAAIQVPCHGKLAQGFDPRLHRRLVESNWIRTVAWTARGILTSGMMFGTLTSCGV